MALDALRLAVDPDMALRAEARALSAALDGASAEEVLQAAIHLHFPGEIALVSSFGAESAVLLSLVARIDKTLPVLFIDTGKLFGETLRYRDLLVERLGLSDVRTLKPAAERLTHADPEGTLWFQSTDACCALRKVEPLSLGLGGFEAWITGRKRYQTETRARLALFEASDGKIKVNPLAGWSAEDIETYRLTHSLPPHPLIAEGFRSIGCMPCTDRVAAGEDVRAGRWRGTDKTECGIHLGLIGREAFGSGI